MYALKRVLLLAVFVTVAVAQSPDLLLSDTRISIHTLVREDVFAGLLANDLEQLARGEKNIDVLLEKRPSSKGDLLAWKGSATMYRAVRAYEGNNTAEFQQNFRRALDLFSQANQLSGGGVPAIVGGTYVVLADRLPKENRAAAWAQAYDSYKMLWKQQAPAVDKLPVHLRGELLGGLAASAQRTGHTEELATYLDKIIELLPNTPYEPVARQWKKDPNVAASSTITCMTCHDAGRLSARVATLNK